MIRRPLAFLACLFLVAAVILMRLHPVRGCLPDIGEGTVVTVKGRLSDRYYKNDSYILVLSDAAPENGDQSSNKILVYLENDHKSLTDLPKTGSSVTVKGEFSLFNSATNPGEFNMQRQYGGGTIVALGTPEEVVKNKKSFTGKYLKGKLK